MSILPTNTEIKQAQELDREFLELTDQCILHPYFVPLNQKDEQAKVLAAYHNGSCYNPRFEYQPIPRWPIVALEQFIEKTRGPGLLTRLFHGAARELREQIRMLEQRQAQVITCSSLEIWGCPHQQQVARAYAELLTPATEQPNDSSADLNGEQVLPRFAARLAELGLDWECALDPVMTATARCDVKRKRYTMRPDISYSPARVEQLMVHEIEAHIFRCANGERQPLRLFARGLPHYVMLEEGLAMATEEQQGVLSQRSVRSIAAYVVAVDVALHASFYDVFRLLAQYFKPAQAFYITQRIKRGWEDLSQPGTYSRDYVYYVGLQKTREFWQTHPRWEDRALLYMGKVGLDDFPMLRALVDSGWLVFPTYLPQWLKEQQNE